MSNAFGPKKPLFGPYTYRVKQNSNGDTLIAVYHGSKRIAHIDAYWAYSMRAIEEHEADEARRASGSSGGRGRRLVCASDLRALGAEGRYPNVLAVGHAFMDDEAYKGKGIGRAMYEAMMVEGFAVRQTRIGGQPGPMFFVPDECKGAGNTSAEAQRVWASLARDYPSQGTSIRVDAPPVIGSRAPRPNPRRWNPAPKVAYDRDEGELVVPPGYAVRLTKLGRMGSAPERVARLAELVPARETHAFALHPENWAGTFASLTGKDRQKVMSFKPEAIALTPDTLVGEMKIASRYLWHGDDADALAYRDSVRRLADADIRAYRQPELLVPRTNPRRRNSAKTREADENVPDCAWCGAACDQPHPYPNRRGEVFCSPSHRSASNRALARVLGAHDDSSPRRRWNPGPTETPASSAAFRRWFGKSKVVDTSGDPLVVYHGSRATFDTFRRPDIAAILARGDATEAEMNQGMGIYFTDSAENAATYGYEVYPVYLRMLKPLIVDAQGENWSYVPFKGSFYYADDIVSLAEEKGHDGVIFLNIYDTHSGNNILSNTYVVFSPKQIKSATKNAGTFDPDDANIYQNPRRNPSKRNRSRR